VGVDVGAGVGQPRDGTAENCTMIPYVPPIDRGEALSRFEQMVLG